MSTQPTPYKNPFRPGAGHMPLYLAGREEENKEFQKLLEQDTILENLVLTGLRGLGKTVLLETLKPLAIQAGWLWAGTDLSETMSLSEANMATRLLTDLSVITSSIVVAQEQAPVHFSTTPTQKQIVFDYPTLVAIYQSTPGLVADKLKHVLETIWKFLPQLNKRGIVFAYDEAQNLADHSSKDQYPLSLLLDVFQSLQRKDIRFMLVLTGLPTLFPKLVEARTFAERMFHVLFLEPLNERETEDAIKRPIAKTECPLHIADDSIKIVWRLTNGYPYFVQFVCRELYDTWLLRYDGKVNPPPYPIDAIVRKLDTDFFAGRWAKSTDRQRQLLGIVARLPNSDAEFAVLDVVGHSANKALEKPFSSSSINQMFVILADAGLIYKNRHGKYSFAVPMLGDFIRRNLGIPTNASWVEPKNTLF